MKNLHRLYIVLIPALVIALCLSIVPMVSNATESNEEIIFPTSAQDGPAQEEEGDIRVPIGSLPTDPSEPSTEPTDPSQPEGLAGDFTGDGQVTNEDVVYLLWHTLFPDTNPISINGDFTADGQITNEDVVYLLWHTLFPDTNPL